jgi:DNA polymerase-3 subunit delta'
MLAHNNSYILISNDIENEFNRIKDELKPLRVIPFLTDEFKIEDAKAVIAQAYISESELKYIVLGANSFNAISQNALLKILEEPPKNVAFIIITPIKSNLLPTIRSRLPIIKGKIVKDSVDVDLNLARLNYDEVFNFLKENARVTKSQAKLLIEAIFKKATIDYKIVLNEDQLSRFDMAYRLLELNSKPQNVLSMVLMGFGDSLRR